jgi:predicted TIM-barrel fold metal-dependent hydrolase
MERRLITTDCHIAPPYSLVEELPESYREHFPRLDRRADGAYVVQPLQREMVAMMGDAGRGMKVDDEPRALARAAVGNVCDEAAPSFDAAEQLADLERDGVYGAVLIGRLSAFDFDTPPEIDAAYCKLVNDWQAETWGRYLDRVAPGIYLPFKDVGASVKELERAAGMGLRPALLPDGIFDTPYHLPAWEPLWEAADGLGVPITMHVGGMRMPGAYRERELTHRHAGSHFIGWYNQCVGMGETLGWLTFSGIFERYPNLHVVMTEGYAAWLAFAIQFYDHHWEGRFGATSHMMGGDAGKLEAPPSLYLKRQAHATFMWDPVAVRVRDVTGLDCLLWGNDYPHREGSFPFSQEWVDKQFAGVPEDEVDIMVRGNAARIFNIDI